MLNVDPKSLPVYPVGNGYAPALDHGPRTIPITLDFNAAAAADGSIYVNLSSLQAEGKIGLIQSIWVNNTDNAAALTVTSLVTNQIMTIPARANVVQPLFCGDPCQLVFTTTPGAFTVNVELLNVPLAPSQMGPITVNASLTTTGTFTNAADSSLNVGGASQQLFAANANRKGWIIQNPATEIESLWIEFGGAATAGSPSIEVTPGSFLPQFAVSTQEIQWNAATAGHTINAKELA